MASFPFEIVRRRIGYKFPRLGPAANSVFFKLAPRFIDTELFPGIHVRLDVSDLTQRTTYWQGDRFESPTVQILGGWAKAGATAFFDIGSNYGFFSYYMLSRHSGIKVYSFEPNPVSYKIIETVKAENELDDLQPNRMGLSDLEETLQLHQGAVDSGHSTVANHPDMTEQHTVAAPVMPFDAWRERAGLALPDQPAWIAKIDVEGFEPRVLRGMADALERRAFAGIVVEVKPFMLNLVRSKPEELFQIMDAHGYRPMASFDACGSNGNGFFVPKA